MGGWGRVGESFRVVILRKQGVFICCCCVDNNLPRVGSVDTASPPEGFVLKRCRRRSSALERRFYFVCISYAIKNIKASSDQEQYYTRWFIVVLSIAHEEVVC